MCMAEGVEEHRHPSMSHQCYVYESSMQDVEEHRHPSVPFITREVLPNEIA